MWEPAADDAQRGGEGGRSPSSRGAVERKAYKVKKAFKNNKSVKGPIYKTVTSRILKT